MSKEIIIPINDTTRLVFSSGIDFPPSGRLTIEWLLSSVNKHIDKNIWARSTTVDIDG
jgi:hypothetical protein